MAVSGRWRLGASTVALLLAWVVGATITLPTIRAATTPFTDIAGTTFEADIAWLYDAGITKGCTPTLYCPDDQVTRGQMAAFLVRMFKPPTTTTDFFTDDDTSTYESEIDRLAAAGITKGCTASTFCPGAQVRRDEMATFLSRAIPLTVGAGRNYFYDDNGNTHEAGIDRAAAAGIGSGCGPWRFCPADAVTRGEMAAFLHRVVVPVASPPYPVPELTRYVALAGTDAGNDCIVASSPCLTIAHALVVAVDGDTISIGPGTFHEGGLEVDKSLDIVGDAAGTTIDGSGGEPLGVLAVLWQVDVTLDRLTITGGHRAVVGAATNEGGGIWNVGNLTVRNSVISGNSANGRGGGIYNANTLHLVDSVVMGNTAKVLGGGGILNSQRLTVTDSTVSGNIAGAEGGGILSLGGRFLLITGSTISGNTAKGGGGGGISGDGFTIVNSTVSGNVASLDGGGIEGHGTLTVTNATISRNTAAAGGGIKGHGAIHLKNALIVGNSSGTGGPVAGTITSSVASLVGVPAGLSLADILDPAGLGFNGGATKTIALVDTAENPALDTGDGGTCAGVAVKGLDQRGLPRTPPCDIGAFEIQP